MLCKLICCNQKYYNKLGKNSSEKLSHSPNAIQRYLVATICIFFVVMIWLSMAELGKDIQFSYRKPILLSVLAHISYIIFLPIWGLCNFFKHWRSSSSRDLKYNSATAAAGELQLYHIMILGSISLLSCIFWNISLPLTSVSGNTAIYQSSCAIVFTISIFFLKETVNRIKVAAVALSILGVFCISFSSTKSVALVASPDVPKENANLTAAAQEKSDAATSEMHSNFPKNDIVESNPCFEGYLLCAASTVAFSFFEVFSKKWVEQTNSSSPFITSLKLTSLMGIFTLIFGVPLLVFLHYVGLEPFELPLNRTAILTVFLIAILDAFFILFILLTIHFATPLFASVGCLTQLPTSMLWDWLVYNYELPPWGLVGVIFIFFSFIVFIFSEFRSDTSSMYEPVINYSLNIPSTSINKKRETQELKDDVALPPSTLKTIEMVHL